MRVGAPVVDKTSLQQALSPF